MASRNGNAIVAPMPLRTVRRGRDLLIMAVLLDPNLTPTESVAHASRPADGYPAALGEWESITLYLVRLHPPCYDRNTSPMSLCFYNTLTQQVETFAPLS